MNNVLFIGILFFSRSCILQGIFIMNKIGLPKDNMFLMSAGRIKALILEEKAIDLLETHFPVYSRIYGM